MQIFSRGQLTDLWPMDSEANAASELDRMNPIPGIGFGSGLGEIGSQMGYGAALAALKQRLEREQGERQARTATDVAGINAGATDRATQAGMLKALAGNQTGMLTKLAELESNRELQEAIKRMTMEELKYREGQHNLRTDKDIAYKTEATNKKLSQDKELRDEMMRYRMMNVGVNMPADVAQGLARKELGAKHTPQQLTDKTIEIQQRAKRIPPEQLNSAFLKQKAASMSDDDGPFQHMIAGARASIDPNDPYTQGSESNPPAMDISQNAPRSKNPMSAFLSSGVGAPSSMTWRMYAPADRLASGGGGTVVNDPRADAMKQSIARVNEDIGLSEASTYPANNTNTPEGPRPSRSSYIHRANPFPGWTDKYSGLEASDLVNLPVWALKGLDKITGRKEGPGLGAGLPEHVRFMEENPDQIPMIGGGGLNVLGRTGGLGISNALRTLFSRPGVARELDLSKPMSADRALNEYFDWAKTPKTTTPPRPGGGQEYSDFYDAMLENRVPTNTPTYETLPVPYQGPRGIPAQAELQGVRDYVSGQVPGVGGSDMPMILRTPRGSMPPGLQTVPYGLKVREPARYTDMMRAYLEAMDRELGARGL